MRVEKKRENGRRMMRAKGRRRRRREGRRWRWEKGEAGQEVERVGGRRGRMGEWEEDSEG